MKKWLLALLLFWGALPGAGKAMQTFYIDVSLSEAMDIADLIVVGRIGPASGPDRRLDKADAVPPSYRVVIQEILYRHPRRPAALRTSAGFLAVREAYWRERRQLARYVERGLMPSPLYKRLKTAQDWPEIPLAENETPVILFLKHDGLDERDSFSLAIEGAILPLDARADILKLLPK